MRCLSAGLANGHTSRKGTSNTAWGTAADWLANVPMVTTGPIVGEADFTGQHRRAISTTTTFDGGRNTRRFHFGMVPEEESL